MRSKYLWGWLCFPELNASLPECRSLERHSLSFLGRSAGSRFKLRLRTYVSCMQLIDQSGEPGPAPVASRIRPFFLHRTQQLFDRNPPYFTKDSKMIHSKVLGLTSTSIK
ncbi:hypothetical protein LEP1GSC186_1337 [Leptospira noguchii serovar Autumnalis str. ZUN142]|uniref:Uncharacterized protein n=1 Tax=Leptospira noguchii serovar Autumnalis str. ZUN142 TaxID=1085540 RepID=M6UFX5_9LEPT|nr:hypothetical protein LEP1GSC186_1337 [Leptospira noguchii serovar Autumnalis str. ZUN142]